MKHFLMPPDPETSTDREVLVKALHRVADGDHDALETVYRLTSGKLFSLLRRMLPTEAVAEELLQDVYLTVWDKARVYNAGIASPMTWLITIARNRAIDHLRKHPTLKEVSVENLMLYLRDPGPTALAHLETEQEIRRLQGCLEELDERQRAVIRAAFFGGITYEDLARKTSVPVGTMKSWIRRGLLRLKKCLER
jgi:RNA polymerase sigma-70 factor (ECF subfamily)